MKRNNYDVRADILRLCRTPKKKTWIVYGSNTNFKMMDRYLSQLVDVGHIRVEGDLFFTSELGNSWVSNFDKLQ